MTAARIPPALAGAATLIVVVGLADGTAAAATLPGAIGRLLPALLVNAGAATVAWLEGAITRSGAVAGSVIGAIIYVGSGWEGWLVLAATVVMAVLASHAGANRKRALGISQEQEGPRGAGHAVANCGAAAAAAIVAITSPHQAAAWVALVAALTAAGADTVASETGKAWGRRTLLIVGFRSVAPGTPGAVSVEGSLANVAAAFAVATFAATLGLIPGAAIPSVVIAALVGATLESVLAATVERRGLLDNHVLNFINASAAACTAVYLI